MFASKSLHKNKQYFLKHYRKKTEKLNSDCIFNEFKLVFLLLLFGRNKKLCNSKII